MWILCIRKLNEADIFRFRRRHIVLISSVCCRRTLNRQKKRTRQLIKGSREENEINENGKYCWLTKTTHLLNEIAPSYDEWEFQQCKNVRDSLEWLKFMRAILHMSYKRYKNIKFISNDSLIFLIAKNNKHFHMITENWVVGVIRHTINASVNWLLPDYVVSFLFRRDTVADMEYDWWKSRGFRQQPFHSYARLYLRLRTHKLIWVWR